MHPTTSWVRNNLTFIIFRYSFFFKGSKIIISFFKFEYIFSFFFTANEAGIVQFVKRPGAILENGSIIGKELCLKEIGPVPYKLFKNLVKSIFLQIRRECNLTSFSKVQPVLDRTLLQSNYLDLFSL